MRQGDALTKSGGRSEVEETRYHEQGLEGCGDGCHLHISHHPRHLGERQDIRQEDEVEHVGCRSCGEERHQRRYAYHHQGADARYLREPY